MLNRCYFTSQTSLLEFLFHVAENLSYTDMRMNGAIERVASLMINFPSYVKYRVLQIANIY